MMNNDQLIVAMGAVRDQMLAVLLDHERSCHAGAPCWGNRVSTLAYLAHCMGLDSRETLRWKAYMLDLLDEYEAMCKKGGCDHAT